MERDGCARGRDRPVDRRPARRSRGLADGLPHQPAARRSVCGGSAPPASSRAGPPAGGCSPTWRAPACSRCRSACSALAIVQADGWGWLAVPTVVASARRDRRRVLFGRRCRQHRCADRRPRAAALAQLRGHRRPDPRRRRGVLRAGAGQRPVSHERLGVLRARRRARRYAGAVPRRGGGDRGPVALTTGRDPRPLLVVGSLIWAAGPLLLIAGFSPTPEYLTAYLPAAAILAIGIGIAFPLVGAIAVAGAPAAASRRRPRSTAPSARSEPRSASPSSWRSSATRRPPRPRRPSSVPGCSPPAASCWSHSARWRWVGCGRRRRSPWRAACRSWATPRRASPSRRRP